MSSSELFKNCQLWKNGVDFAFTMTKMKGEKTNIEVPPQAVPYRSLLNAHAMYNRADRC